MKRIAIASVGLLLVCVSALAGEKLEYATEEDLLTTNVVTRTKTPSTEAALLELYVRGYVLAFDSEPIRFPSREIRVRIWTKRIKPRPGSQPQIIQILDEKSSVLNAKKVGGPPMTGDVWIAQHDGRLFVYIKFHHGIAGHGFYVYEIGKKYSIEEKVICCLGIVAGWVEGTLTDYVCSGYVHEKHISEVKASQLPCLNIMGRGTLKRWTLRKRFDPIINAVSKEYDGDYILSGAVHSNNTGGPVQGVPIYTGDLSRQKHLRLIALSNMDGEFKVRLPSYAGDAKTEIIDKYLYLGGGNLLLIRYSIPYKAAQPTAPLDRAERGK